MSFCGFQPASINISRDPINVCDSDIVPSCVKLLGVHIDSNLSLNTQVSKIVIRSGFLFPVAADQCNSNKFVLGDC